VSTVDAELETAVNPVRDERFSATIIAMRRAGWLKRQPRWRQFVIFWAFMATGAVVGQAAGSIGVDLYHPGHPLVMPPIWTYPLDLFWTAVSAALVVALRRGRRTRES
jgi:hypothetical protein